MLHIVGICQKYLFSTFYLVLEVSRTSTCADEPNCALNVLHTDRTLYVINCTELSQSVQLPRRMNVNFTGKLCEAKTLVFLEQQLRLAVFVVGELCCDFD